MCGLYMQPRSLKYLSISTSIYSSSIPEGIISGRGVDLKSTRVARSQEDLIEVYGFGYAKIRS